MSWFILRRTLSGTPRVVCLPAPKRFLRLRGACPRSSNALIVVAVVAVVGTGAAILGGGVQRTVRRDGRPNGGRREIGQDGWGNDDWDYHYYYHLAFDTLG